MGVDWHEYMTIYGYVFEPSDEDMDYREFAKKMYKLSKNISKRKFKVSGLVQSVGNIYGYDKSIDELAVILYGFEPSDIMEENVKLANELKKFVENTDIFDEFERAEEPIFYCGRDWYSHIVCFED